VNLLVHDECSDAAAKVFLDGFLPATAHGMAQRLGVAAAEPLHVVLSDRATHEWRFPPRIEELLSVIDAEEAEQSSESELSERYTRVLYAHGVATRARSRHQPPSDVVVGEPVIYLDVESIREAAGEVKVPEEAMLGRVAAHELAHVLRDHITSGIDTPVHGWLAEGDAQRDAWLALTEGLADPKWSAVARQARAAQVRLASVQPPAYDRFDASPEERRALAGPGGLPDASTWLVRTPRELFGAISASVIEVPLTSGVQLPVPGDTVYIRGIFDVGPWVVVGVSASSRLADAADEAAVRRAERDASPYRRSDAPVWIQLAPRGSLQLGETDDQPVSAMYPRRLTPDEVSDLERRLDRDARAVAEAEMAAVRAQLAEVQRRRRSSP
jgi:hypothetical protein